MAASASGSLTISGSLTPTNAAGLFDAISALAEFRLSGTLTNGTGVNKIDQCVAKGGTLAASGTVTISLNNGTAKDQFGNVLTITKLKMLVILNTSTTVATIDVDNSDGYAGALSNPTIHPGGAIVIFNPTAAGYVTQGDNTGSFVITNNSGAVAATYKFYAAGE